MAYTVHEIFLTAQGEGANLGRVAVFVRFSGCNLWSGREEDRATAICRFCDTEFRGGKTFADAAQLADAVAVLWPANEGERFAVLTGGEPLLQADAKLVQALRANGFRVAVETNGTQSMPCDFDWVCVSPKARAELVLESADELKLVYPQPGAEPERFASFRATHRWLSPMDGDLLPANTGAAAAYCLEHPVWRLNIQAHKIWGLR
jgi:7-carboxy-7-deazaguanine synthase